MAKNVKPRWGGLRPSRDTIKDALRPYRISARTLRKMISEARSSHLPKPRNVIDAGFRLSAYILLDFLGPDWIDHYLTHKGLVRKSTYFDNNDLFFLRVVALAEMLLNLQDAPGFRGCLSVIARGDIESGFAELEAAKFLSWFDAKFRFNEPTAQPKKDFDLHVIFRNSHTGCGETESKREIGALTKNTVFNSLDHARKQLPNDKPGVIFLKLPETWAEAENRKTIDEQVYRFLRGTKRIVAVEVFATGFRIKGGVAEPIVGGVEVLNHNHRFDRTLNWSLIGPVLPEPTQLLPPIWWRSIYALMDPTVDPRSFGP